MSATVGPETAVAPAVFRTIPSRQLRVLAPLSGQIWPLERVPDPVFAQKMVGDGLSIDPVDSVLVAPCDGEVVLLHAAGHAVTLRTHEGVELLMHVGIDTINLKGEGFRPLVKVGDPSGAVYSLIVDVAVADEEVVVETGDICHGRDLELPVTTRPD